MKSDAQIQQDIMDQLTWDSSIDATHIAVAVRDGVVTLNGAVGTLTEKWEAEHIVKSIAGVRGVADELEVRLPAANERTDSDIARAAALALEWHSAIPHKRITVTVRDGWLTLEGAVSWPYQKTTAEEVVRPLMGVKGVTNQLVIEPLAEAHEVSNGIAAAFQRHAALTANKIHVDVRGTTVILRGDVHAWFERTEAERVARSAPGITAVDNRIMVTP
jgi:osmotically-inducible protein OsmY